MGATYMVRKNMRKKIIVIKMVPNTIALEIIYLFISIL
jgi:hypothetical protein